MHTRLQTACIGIGLSIVIPATALAQQGGNIDLQAFRPAMDSRGFITLNASQVLGHREVSFGLVTNWGKGLLRFESGDNTYEVRHIVTPTLTGAFGLRAGPLELELGASVPFSIMAGDRDPDQRDPDLGAINHQFDGQGVGDIGLHLKWRLMNTSRGPFGLAVVGSAYLPTASEENSWLGNDSVTPQAMLVLDKELGRTKIVANGGIRVSTGGSVRFEDNGSMINAPMTPTTDGVIEVGSTIPFGAGLSYAIVPGRFDAVAEVFGAVPLDGENYFPLEAVGGIKVYLAKNSFLSIGGGTGFLPGEGANPDVRAFLGIVFEPNIGDRDGDGLKDDIDQCPDNPEDFDGFEDEDGCPELDNDHDGIVDLDDRCPNDPEDKDGFEDEDGCPEGNEFDRDGDGILDDEDQCPDDPEDKDDFEDEDGCPDPDNDNDQILDIDDLCPNDPEDYDEFEDQDGCPDPDNDRDLILDVDDQCPGKDGEDLESVRETYNQIDDHDGCPDGPAIITGDTTSVILQEIYFEFDSAVIKKQSHPILEAVAKSLSVFTDIRLVEVQGHTDERGSDAYNLDLSQRRAESVVNFLVENGVARDRLDPVGYGERVPIDSRSNQNAWAKNRRVEFHVIKRNDE